MDEKICPLMSRNISQSWTDECPTVIAVRFEPVNCERDKCALWVDVYTVEKIPYQCCAFVMMAVKNNEGYYKV